MQLQNFGVKLIAIDCSFSVNKSSPVWTLPYAHSRFSLGHVSVTFQVKVFIPSNEYPHVPIWCMNYDPLTALEMAFTASGFLLG